MILTDWMLTSVRS
ncbi:Protein of unknown function [Propionibacterium freudenreichii]|nr:Protein of unknown function [Propionibacterium freudenreichii]